MQRFGSLIVVVTIFLSLPHSASSQSILLAPENLKAVNVSTTQSEWKGKDAVQLRITKLAETIAVVKGTDLTDGTIELEVAGLPAKDAPEGSRGFIGVAFRVQEEDGHYAYDAFYLRPTNGRADDQIRRNHSTQYISHPDFTWYKLRQEFPKMYESYVDLIPGEWTKMKVVVKGNRAELYVHGADQPCLIVKDLKGAAESGPIALWVGSGTEGYFRNLKVTRTN